MSNQGGSQDEIKQRIKPTLDKVAVDGLKAWLKTIGLTGSASTRPTITDLVAKKIKDGDLAEDALEQALIGFEEASDMRIYLFNLEDVPDIQPDQWLPAWLRLNDIPVVTVRTFAGDRTKAMSPVYAHLEGGLLRVKWAEEHQRAKLNDRADAIEVKPIAKRVVLIADIGARTAELRLNPPENKHPHEDPGGKITAEAYYNAYIEKAREVLGCSLAAVELRPVIRRLVEEEEQRLVRIHIDDHTNQTNTKSKTNSRRADVRDDPDWKLMYKVNGASWAWDAQSFYWLPQRSAGFLARELFSHIDAEEGFIKVNADCSDDEVTYVISQIRAR
jgi:hypothetical protein